MIGLVGVVVSAGVWALGLLATRRVTGSAIAGAPESWRERFAAEYAWSYAGSLFAVLFGFAATMCFAARAVIDVIGA